MQRIFLKAKIHRARVTAACLDYEGSLSIDRNLMDQADIAEHEQVGVYNLSNGERFDTYAIAGPEGSGEICLNGAAARLVHRGDKVIIASFEEVEDDEIDAYHPKLVLLNEDNSIKKISEPPIRRP